MCYYRPFEQPVDWISQYSILAYKALISVVNNVSCILRVFLWASVCSIPAFFHPNIGQKMPVIGTSLASGNLHNLVYSCNLFHFVVVGQSF